MIRRLLAAGTVAITTFGTDGQWGEIDNAVDLALYEAMLADKTLALEPVAPATGAG